MCLLSGASSQDKEVVVLGVPVLCRELGSEEKLSRAVRLLHPSQPHGQIWNNLHGHDTLICPSGSTESVSCMTGVIWPLLPDINKDRQAEMRAFHVQGYFLWHPNQDWKPWSASAAFSSFQSIAQLKI